jgi:hypothetical protein
MYGKRYKISKYRRGSSITIYLMIFDCKVPRFTAARYYTYIVLSAERATTKLVPGLCDDTLYMCSVSNNNRQYLVSSYALQ